MTHSFVRARRAVVNPLEEVKRDEGGTERGGKRSSFARHGDGGRCAPRNWHSIALIRFLEITGTLDSERSIDFLTTATEVAEIR